MNEFTKSEWRALNDSVFCGKELVAQAVGGDLYKHCTSVDYNTACNNGHLIATAGTTATKLAEQGFDAVKVLEVLPELIRVIQDLPSHELIGEALDEALEQCRGES